MTDDNKGAMSEHGGEGSALFSFPPADAGQCAILDLADKAGFQTDSFRIAGLIFARDHDVTAEVTALVKLLASRPAVVSAADQLSGILYECENDPLLMELCRPNLEKIAQRVCKPVVSAEAVPQWTMRYASDRRFQHVKSGGIYRLVCYARIETDKAPSVVYESEESSGDVWVRPYWEFFDGRFEEIEPVAQKSVISPADQSGEGKVTPTAREIIAEFMRNADSPEPEEAADELIDALDGALDIYEDVYEQIANMIHMDVDAGSLPGSVSESVSVLYEHWKAAQAPIHAGMQFRYEGSREWMDCDTREGVVQSGIEHRIGPSAIPATFSKYSFSYIEQRPDGQIEHATIHVKGSDPSYMVNRDRVAAWKEPSSAIPADDTP